MFITKTDLLTSILLEELDEITRSDDDLVTQAITVAIDEARSYLYDTFDVDVIFAKTGTSRNQLLVNLCVDIAIYTIVSRCYAGQDNTDRKNRYDRATKWFKSIQKTEIYIDLERREATEQKHISYNSNPKRINYY